MQFEFTNNMEVHGWITQGHPANDWWSRSYQVLYQPVISLGWAAVTNSDGSARVINKESLSHIYVYLLLQS